MAMGSEEVGPAAIQYAPYGEELSIAMPSGPVIAAHSCCSNMRLS
jgi:hypothetical protein